MDVLVVMVRAPRHTHVIVVERSLQAGGRTDGLAGRERERERPSIIEKERERAKERESELYQEISHIFRCWIKIIITLL